MKLPDDKNERDKMLILIAIGVAATLYCSYRFGVKPLLARRAAARARIVEVEDLLFRAGNDIALVPQYLKQNRVVLNHILEISEEERHILRPNLGNYLLVATDIVTAQTDKLGLEVESIAETLAVERPARKADKTADPNAPRFIPYTVNVSLSCSLIELIRLTRALEDENPYLCITRLGVLGQPDNPERHAISFNIQWPIWADHTHAMRLAAERLSDEERR
jgi:hypothetical protein